MEPRLIFIDEVGQIPQSILGLSSQRLSDTLCNKVMGGIDSVLCVDWKQLGPTANKRVMDKVTSKSTLAHKTGLDVYNCANHYWYLTQNQRI